MGTFMMILLYLAVSFSLLLGVLNCFNNAKYEARIFVLERELRAIMASLKHNED